MFKLFKVAILSSFDRRIASWLYGEVPKGTVEEAINMFLKFEDESPIQLKDCRVHLAKCYIALNEYHTAVHWLEQALQLPVKDSEVSKIHNYVTQSHYSFILKNDKSNYFRIRKLMPKPIYFSRNI